MSKPTGTDWTLEQGLAFFRKVERLFNRYGWNVALYGSTVKNGQGRDLDMIAVPWRHHADHLGLVEFLRSDLGAQLGDDYEGLMGTNSYALILPDTRIVDISFRPADKLCPVCRGYRF